MKLHLLLIVSVLCVFTAEQTRAQDEYTWTQKTSLPAIGRHRACGCSINNRGYIGLGHINNWNASIIYSDWWEYDPGTDTWMQKADFGGGQRYHAVAFSIGNYAYVGTGSDFGGDHDDLWRYNPVTNTWLMVTQVPGGVRSGAVAFTIDGTGYVALGDYQDDCWAYDPVLNSWGARAVPPVSGYSSVAAVENGKAYVGIGESTGWSEFNPVTNSWTVKASFPGASRFGSGCFAYNGWVYVVSGSDWSQEFPDSYAYNPLTNTWVQVSDFPGQGRHYFVCFSIGNRAYGGTGTNGTNFNDFWEYGNLAAGTGETEAKNKAVSFFPNPVVDAAVFHFENALDHEASFSLVDLSGKKVSEEKISPCSDWNFTRGDLAAGNYFYSIVSDGKVISDGKMILQ
ncbi:MAG TPA: kelch repeat-containing protein [Bacteroidia bacterium]|nr:kelch repeat-containing protein [Bacteroidia bacterium]